VFRPIRSIWGRRKSYCAIVLAIPLLAVGCWLAAKTLHAAGQRKPAAEVCRLGGAVVYSEGMPRRLDRLFGGDLIATVEVVYLDGTNVQDDDLAGLKGLPDLEVLNLSRTQVTDQGLKHLKGLKRLKTLVLIETGVTGAGIEALRKSLPRTRIYN